MNFYQEKKNAQVKSQRLLVVLGFIIIITIFCINLLFLYLYKYFFVGGVESILFSDLLTLSAGEVKLVISVSISLLLLILFGSLTRLYELRPGKKSIEKILQATKLGGVNLNYLERRLLNIVEELSIACGLPVPTVYILEHEPSINALAGGADSHHAFIGVTRGAINSLNREQLSALVAHELGHIINEDIILNQRLVILLSGLSKVSLFGAFISRSFGIARNSRRRVAGNIFMSILGLIIYLIGSLSLFISRLLKYGISRQREFKADACAVQFTRNPHALIEVFKKVISQQGKSFNLNEQKEDFSHMFFIHSFSYSQLLSTHPPISERIKRINPSINLEKYNYKETRRENNHEELVSLSFSQSVTKAQELYKNIPGSILIIAHSTKMAPFLIASLWFDSDQEICNSQIEAVGRTPKERSLLLQTHRRIKRLSYMIRLLLIEISSPILQANPSIFERTLANVFKSVRLKKKTYLRDYLLLECLKITNSQRVHVSGRKKLKTIGCEIYPLHSLLVSYFSGDPNKFHQEVTKSFGWTDFQEYETHAVKSEDFEKGLNLLRSLKSDELNRYLCYLYQEVVFFNEKQWLLWRFLCFSFGISCPLVENKNENALKN